MSNFYSIKLWWNDIDKINFILISILLIFGIILSVVIYYINYFSAVLGQNLSLPSYVSVWTPILLIFLSCAIGLVRINEK